MSRGQHDDLSATGAKKRIGTDEDRGGPRLHHSRKGRVDFAIGAGSQHIDVASDGGSSRLRVHDNGFSDWAASID